MRLMALPLMLVLTGCVTIADQDWTKSGFKSVSPGALPGGLVGAQSGTVEDAFGAVHFYSGLGSEGAVAYAGVDPSTNVGATGTGTAALSGSYEVIGLSDIYLLTSGDFKGTLYGTPFSEEGVIGLTADFNARTLTGAAGNLSVDGTISGGSLAGGVTYAGDTGSLSGRIGTLGAVGAFHGNDDQRVFSGGFVVSND